MTNEIVTVICLSDGATVEASVMFKNIEMISFKGYCFVKAVRLFQFYFKMS